MDEEEKPFPIEFIVILLLIAIANDIAEVFFDFLDFTGVGIAGEAIMEPANFVLDFFFTGIFWWKVGAGGGTITQYIGDLLEPTFIPGRTISVALGMWVANHPSSLVGKVATTAASLETGNVGDAAGEAEGVAAGVGKEAASAEKGLQKEGAAAAGEEKAGASPAGSESPETTPGEDHKPPEKDVMASPEEGNPLENLQEQLEEESPKEEPKPQEQGEDLAEAA